MKVSLVIREGAGKNRRYVKVNKKVYPDGTVFCLRYKRKFETLNADNLTAALAARAIKEAALLTGQGSTASAQAKRIGIDDAIAVYLSNIAEAEFVRADVRLEEDVRNLVDQTVEWLTANSGFPP